ncbi:glycosyltransferase [Noviherbaspirillum sp. UKPF54]|uniref:glycosyltransferase n=1 Tax=Noviherbaspirillum sp. UKPF54 TaxID=2601898 RepID=UPI00143DA247|nr:glycosyltransferase [Noviherbaspirillum sp. UKPF54]
MIYDAFLFFNELELLRLRLQLLDGVVDKFVLVESTLTHQGKEKPLYFDQNKKDFVQYADKIIHVIVDDPIERYGEVPVYRYQRDAISRGLQDCKHGDLILISDLDEIPSPAKVREYSATNEIVLFKQRLYYYFFNCYCAGIPDLPWSCLVPFSRFTSPQALRDLVVSVQGNVLGTGKYPDSPEVKFVEGGGWHFSYFGGVERVITKIESFADSEFNRDEFKDRETILQRMLSGSDLYGRPIEYQLLDESGDQALPSIVRNNRDAYSNFFLPESELKNRTPVSPYKYDFDPNGDSTAARVTRMVGKNKRVLELGCGYGVMTKVFAEHNGCHVFGIEIDAASASMAEPYCEKLLIADLDTLDWDAALGQNQFEVIVAADVIEHLRDPLKCLAEMQRFLTPDGYIVISIPNVAHNGIISELLNEDFAYRRVGLLDETHIRFFAWKSLKKALLKTNLKIVDLSKTEIPAQNTEFKHAWENLPHWLAEILSTRPEGNVYQYILKVQPDVAGAALDEAGAEDVKPVLAPVKMEYRILDAAIEERDVAREAYNAAILERDAALVARDTAVLEIERLWNTKSWRVTRPLRLAVRVMRHGLVMDDRQRMIQELRRIYHRLPLPMPMKNALRWVYRNGIQKAQKQITAPKLFLPPSITPSVQEMAKTDYFVWGVIDWHFRYQRPQQLASALAASGRRVFYISTCLVDGDGAGFEVEALDNSGRIFQLKLYAKNAPVIYSGAPNTAIVAQLRHSVGEVLEWTNSRQIISLVQHPFWFDIATKMPNSRTVYDCMDHHEGFGNTAPEISALEQALLRRADLVVTTSDWLDRTIAAEQAKRRALIRNGGDFQHFSRKPASVYRDSKGRRVIGYYGAIAEWFDLHLVEAVAKHFQDCCILLVGADTVGAKASLRHLDNVRFIGEVPYAELPYFLHGFDVCLLPFKIIPLTLATNPVKVYEYLSAGKPVVSVDLPEMKQFHELVMVTKTAEDFVAAIAHTLENPATLEQISDRQTFAKEQTWSHRVDSLIQHAESTVQDPSVSVIVVTYNNLNLTRACLQSLDERSDYDRMEIIVVDNASSDGSKEFLAEWASTGKNRKLILNEDNRGFAAANNQGLTIAGGDYLVLLNNDTYVTSGWVRTMVQHLEGDKSVGILGPVTNNIGNEAKIEIAYDNMDEMARNAASYTRRHIGHIFDMRTAAFFCVMMPREVYERVGPLDEVFGRGFFEDDDYCRRVEQIGRRVVCAEDVFIHHNLSASFNKLKNQERQALFEQNKKVYEAKWGAWMPHAYRGEGGPAEHKASKEKLKLVERQSK